MKTERFFILIITSLLLLQFNVAPAQVRAGVGTKPNSAVDKTIDEQKRQHQRILRRNARINPDSLREFQTIFFGDSLRQGPIEGKVGLVLSGGGAKGLYHIGVIKALEENDIPIDYVSGTSMGAIIAAFYAAGYSADEMAELATSGMVEEWVSGQIDDSYKFFYNERQDDYSMLSVYADLKRDSVSHSNSIKLALPQGFVNSAQIDMALTEIFAPASALCGGDFDQLMVPFRCIATDMNRHTPVVFTEGDLPFAVRASMSYPLIFSPVTDSNGAVLVDGGCYNNFPWQPLEEDFEPDFLIGAQCIDDNELALPTSSVEQQVMALVTMPTDYTLPDGKSMLIKRNVELGLLNFKDGAEAIEQGYADAMSSMDELKERFLSRRSAAEVERRREEFRSHQPEVLFSNMHIEGLDERQQEYARTFMNFDKNPDEALSGESRISLDEVKERYFTLIGSGEFNSNAFPEIQYDSLREDFAVKFDLSTKPGWRFFVGGNISSTSMNQAYIGFRHFRLRRTASSTTGDFFIGPISSLFRVGGRTSFIKRTPMYIDYSLQASWLTNLTGQFGNISPMRNTLDVRETQVYGHLGFGVASTRKSTLDISTNFGYNYYKYEDTYDEPGNPSTHDRFRFVAARIKFEHNTLDEILYPTHGSRLELSAIGVYGNDRYENAELFAAKRRQSEERAWVGAKFQWEHYPGNWKRAWFSVGYNIEAVYTNHPTFANPYSTTLSKPRYAPITHSQMLYMPEFFASRYLAMGVMPTFQLMPSFYLRAGIYGMLRDALVADEYMHYIADLSFIYHTRIGPVSLSLTKYNFDTKNNLYLMFNFGYAIFGNKSLYY